MTWFSRRGMRVGCVGDCGGGDRGGRDCES